MLGYFDLFLFMILSTDSLVKPSFSTMAASPPVPTGCSGRSHSATSSSFTRFPLPSSTCSSNSNLSNRKPYILPLNLSISFSLAPHPSNLSKSRINYSKIENVDAPSTSNKTEDSLISAESEGILHQRIVPTVKSLSRKQSEWQRIFYASKKVRSVILLNVVTIAFASNIPVLKEVETITDPAAFTVARFVVCAIPFIPYVFHARNDVHARKAGIELGMWLSLAYFMQALGLVTSDAGRASFVSAFTVVVVPVLDGMVGAKVPQLTWFGALMSIVGVALLESSGSPPSIGDLLTFLSAVFFGIHMLRTERISRSTNKNNFLPLLGYEMCAVALLSLSWYLVGSWLTETSSWKTQFWPGMISWKSIVSFPWVPALYTGVFSTGFCLWIEMVAMRDVSATETAIIYSLEPLWGAGFAWFLLGERWGTTGWIGAIFLLAGSLTVQVCGSLLNKPTE